VNGKSRRPRKRNLDNNPGFFWFWVALFCKKWLVFEDPFYFKLAGFAWPFCFFVAGFRGPRHKYV